MMLSDTDYIVITKSTVLISTEKESIYTTITETNIQTSPSTSMLSNP